MITEESLRDGNEGGYFEGDFNSSDRFTS